MAWKFPRFRKRPSPGIYALAIVATIAAEILWGLSTPINKIGLQEVDPALFLAIRYSLSVLLLLPWGWRLTKQLRHSSDSSKTILSNLLSPALSMLLVFTALTFVPSINASVVGAFGPIITTLLAVWLLSEPLRKSNIFGSLVAATGVLVIVIEPIITTGNISTEFFGNILLITGVLMASLGTIIKKPLLKRVSALEMSFVAFIVGAVISWFVVVLKGIDIIPAIMAIDMSGWIPLLYSIFAAGLISFWLYFWSLNILLAEDTAVYTYVDPLVGVIGAAILLGEAASSVFLVGASLVILGIYLAEVHRGVHLHRFFHKVNR